jgi:hypothetical protein
VADIAESILDLAQPDILVDVDPPMDDMLAVMRARRQAQRLDHRLGRLLVAVDGLVRDTNTHGDHSSGEGGA